MGNFIQSFTLIQKNKIILFAHLHVLASSSISNIMLRLHYVPSGHGSHDFGHRGHT